MRFAIIAAVLTCSCADPRADAPDEPGIDHACTRSFSAVVEAWAAASGERVPIECSLLDLEYELQVVESSSDIPCAPEEAGTQVGCTRVDERVIYILRRDQVGMVDTSIHEWIHALTDCVYGDPDRAHLRAGLWYGYGSSSTEVQASALAEIGECL